VMRLVEEGRIDLDEPVWLDFLRPEPAVAITARHLLSHSAGLADPIPIGWAHRERSHVRRSTHTLTREVFARHRKLVHPPDGPSRYTNLGYLLLGELIAHKTGQTYVDHILAHVLTPLGMSTTSFDPSPAAHGHERLFSARSAGLALLFSTRVRAAYLEHGWVGLDPFALEGEAYGGLIGSAIDLARFAQAIMRAEIVRDPYALYRPSSRDGAFGLGFWMLGGGWVGHAGEAAGFTAALRMHPDRGIGAVVLSCNGVERVDSIAIDALSRF
jgi:CubicO group peptidase (beta-lactamase class C family)